MKRVLTLYSDDIKLFQQTCHKIGFSCETETDVNIETLRKILFYIQQETQTPKSDLSETPKTEKWTPEQQEFIKKVNSPPSYPIPPCNYASKDKFIDPKTGLQTIYCDNPKRTKGKPLQIPLIACLKCWERREWFYKKRKQTPRQINEIYCKQGGLWVKPTACINCKNPCEKAPPTNPYLTDIQRYHNSQNQKEE